LRTRVLRRGINLSDPHGAELSTQQKKQNMWEKYVEHNIWKKNKLRIGSHIFRNLFRNLQFTQMIARKYKSYIRQFWRQKKNKRKKMCAVSTGLKVVFLT
jgi:hypothetical protein